MCVVVLDDQKFYEEMLASVIDYDYQRHGDDILSPV